MMITDEERAALQLPPPPPFPISIPTLERTQPAPLADLSVTVRVELGSVRATEGTWEHLRVGDRLPIAGSPQGLAIFVDTYRMGTGSICRVGNHLAVQLHRWGSEGRGQP